MKGRMVQIALEVESSYRNIRDTRTEDEFECGCGNLRCYFVGHDEFQETEDIEKNREGKRKLGVR